MEKFSSEEKASSKLGLKEVGFYLTLFFCLSSSSNELLGSIPDVNSFEDDKMSAEYISKEIALERDKIKDHILSLLGHEEQISQEYNLNKYIPKKSKEYTEMNESQLKQELKQLFPNVDFNVSFEDLSHQLDVLKSEIQRDFFAEINKVYQIEFDSSELSQSAILVLAICIRDNRQNSNLNDLNSIIQERVISYGDKKLGLLYAMERSVEFEKLRPKAEYFLNAFFAIKNYNKGLSMK